MIRTVFIFFGKGLRNGLMAVGALAFSGGILALANYTATQGSGTNFGSVVIGGVHFLSNLVCDFATANQCASVNGSNQLVVNVANANTNGAASIANSSPVTAATVNVTPTDCSIALTLGGTAQNIIAAGNSLHGFTIANIDTSAGSGEPVWMSFTTTAVASTIASYPLAAPTATTFAGLNSYTTPLGFGTNANVSVVAATTGHKISCTKW